MLRKFFFLAGISSLVLLVDAEPAQARRWTIGNPGIHGNIHGVTYRSIRWEQKYGNRRAAYQPARTRFFRCR